MTVRRRALAIPLAALVALVGCRDGVGGPEPASPTPPPRLALLLPAVQAAREAARRAQSEDGTSYELRIEERLFADGRAVGTAALVDERSGVAYRYDFQAGRVACAAGAPVVYLVARAHATPHATPRAAGAASGGVWKTTNFLLTATTTPGLWQLSISPAAGDDPPVHAPLRLRAALEVRFASDPCRA